MTAALKLEAKAESSTGRAFYPHRVEPLQKRLGKLRFFVNFLKNPLRVLPKEVYEADMVAGDQGRLVTWITEPSLIKTVLLDRRDHFNKAIQIRLLGPLLGKGILTSDGNDWKWQRQVSAPIFRHQDLISMVPAIVRCADHMVANWRSAPTGQTRNVDADMSKVTFDVISATLLPSDDVNVAPAIENSSGDFQKGVTWSLLYSLLSAPSWVPRPGRTAALQSVVSLRKSVGRLIAERRASTVKHNDLMQRLMDAKDPETGNLMTDEQLIDNLLTFYLAGHETTAKSLTWTLFLLASAPEWGEKICEEVERVTGGAPVGPEHIEKLVLTQQVIKESMRLFPPVPALGRSTPTETELGGRTIAAGTFVQIPIYAIQRHKKYWTDPDRFDPSRFTPENEAKIPRYVYMPFGAGPRICIGMAFAMIEATALLATLVRAARFGVQPGLEPEPLARVTLVPKGGMPLAVHMR
jgi:cytochrome P450